VHPQRHVKVPQVSRRAAGFDLGLADRVIHEQVDRVSDVALADQVTENLPVSLVVAAP
jgi:hypothetical protein